MKILHNAEMNYDNALFLRVNKFYQKFALAVLLLDNPLIFQTLKGESGTMHMKTNKSWSDERLKSGLSIPLIEYLKW